MVFLHGLKHTCSRWRRHFVDVSRKPLFLLVRFKIVQIFQVNLSEFLRVNGRGGVQQQSFSDGWLFVWLPQ